MRASIRQSLTVDAANNRESNVLNLFIVNFPCFAVTPKYSVCTGKHAHISEAGERDLRHAIKLASRVRVDIEDKTKTPMLHTQRGIKFL